MLRLILVLLLAGWSCAALASESSKAAVELYRTGKYEAAIMAAEAAGDGESLAVAARAAFAEANLSETPCLPCLQRVERLARHSMMLDAAHPEAFVYLAAALGYQARIVGNIRAQFARYPEQAKEAIDKALAIAPDDGWSLASAGAWHIEVVRNAGSVLARALYGARADLGKDYFHRAFAADPDNMVIRFQYALTLSGYDLETNKNEVMAALAAAVSTEPRTVYEGAIKQRAAQLLDLLKANRRADYLALVSRYQGYSG